LAADKHLQGRSDAEVREFLTLFHEFFVRTYTQRLLLFDAPNFAYGAETVTGRYGARRDRGGHARAIGSPSTTRSDGRRTAGVRPTSRSRA
jgi:hypothetical protein